MNARSKATATVKAPGRKWGFLTLFASTGTLFCCALPMLLVSLGLGAASATMIAHVPFLKVMARHEPVIFAFSFLMISISAWSVYRPGRTCPSDPELAAQCAKADRWNKRILFISATIWLIGFSARYLSVPLLHLFG